MPSLRIITLNCWSEGADYEKRWPILAEELAALGPDVAGLQEVFWMEKCEVLRKALGVPTLVNGTRRGGLALLGGPAKIASGHLKFKTRSPNENYDRYALWARLKIGQEPWDFFITHLSWRVPESEIRSRQIAELWDWIDEKNGCARPCILMGDMNAAPGSDEMKFLAGEKWLYVSEEGRARAIKAHEAFRDAFRETNSPESGKFHTWSYRNPYTLRADLPERRIDYIWFRPPASGSVKYKIKSSALCFNRPHGKRLFPSDHFGVLAEIEFSGAPL